MTKKLTLTDILDLRAYERDRIATRTRIMELKRPRRVTVGPFVTLVFENRDTVWYQIQEMARVEKLLRDDQVQLELDTYNPLIPAAGQLSATLFLELTAEDEMREWLPKLVGIERSVRLHLGENGAAEAVVFGPDAAHDAQLTRETVTAAVHYVKAQLTPNQVLQFGRGPVVLAVEHPHYRHQVELSPATIASLGRDLAEED